MAAAKNAGCVIRCNPKMCLAAGYTRIGVAPDKHAKMLMIASFTGKTLQDVQDELLEYALKDVKIDRGDGNLFNLNVGGLEV